MKKLKFIYAFALLGCIAACDDDDNDRPDLADIDEEFVEGAALSNLTEVDFGTLATERGDHDLVRKYGDMMISEHTTAQDELRSLANNFDDVDWPEGLDQQHRQIKEQLMNLSGRAFDSAYMRSQVNDHEKTLSMFDNEINNGRNESVKAYANKYRPHIEMHLHKADSILNVILAQPLDGN